MMKLFPLLLILVALLTACGEPQESARQAKFYAFGTEIDVSLYGVDAETAEKTVDALMKLDLAAGVEVQISLG